MRLECSLEAGTEQLCHQLLRKNKEQNGCGIFIPQKFAEQFEQQCRDNEWIEKLKSENVELSTQFWIILNDIFGYVSIRLTKWDVNGVNYLCLESHKSVSIFFKLKL